MKNNYAVLGIGAFGSRLAVELAKAGHNVMAIDQDPSAIDEIKDQVTEAVVADISNPEVIREIDVSKFNAIILGLSSHFEDAILALTLLKQEGAKNVIAKANSPIQRQILLRLGADEIIQPDQDVAERLAKRLTMTNISDMFKFKGSTIADVIVPESMDGASIRNLDLRNKYNLTILLIKKPGSEKETVWDPNTILNTGDELTIIGQEKDILRVFKK
jgi:trk system potassium uptake protein TrkA